MNRIDKTFRRLRLSGKKAFITYITAGDPDLKATERIVPALAGAGADIIELGIPFSDPLADGPTIQRAIQRSLEKGCTVKKVFALVQHLRKKTEVPLVFMTYYNIIFNYGTAAFVRDAKKAGADGVIVPDLPMEEAHDLRKAADRERFHLIMLTAPTTSPERFRRIAACSRGFVYHVSLTGVTGERKKLSGELKDDVKSFKKTTPKPVCVGFGVSTPAQARGVAAVADGIIVGSAIIRIIEKNLTNRAAMVRRIEKFAGAIADAVHG